MRTSMTAISGSRCISASIESWVRAGVPETYIVRPSVSIARNCSIAWAAVFRSWRPADTW